MPLSQKDIALVRRQFRQIAPLSYGFGAEFFARVFWADGWMRRHLPADIHEPRAMVCEVIGVAVAHLDRLDRLGPQIAGLRRTAGDGLFAEAALPVLRAALLGALGNRLEESFDDTARAAWSNAIAAVFAACRDDGRSGCLRRAA